LNSNEGHRNKLYAGIGKALLVYRISQNIGLWMKYTNTLKSSQSKY